MVEISAEDEPVTNARDWVMKIRKKTRPLISAPRHHHALPLACRLEF